MIDFEEVNFILETQKRKRKKDPKNVKKHKTNVSVKPQESTEKKKKKKHSLLNKEKRERKQKKKEKKKQKRKRRLALELENSLVFTQCGSAQENLFEKPEASTLQQNEKLKPDRLTADSKKKCKRKKKVVFDLSPCNIRVKRPKFASSSIKEEEVVKGAASCSQDAVTGNSRDQDSQGTSDGINSQDLFITQKTFRASLSEPSSGEVSDGAFMLPPQFLTQQGECQQMKQFHEESEKSPQDSQSHQVCVQPNPEDPEEDKGHHKLHEKRKKSFLKEKNTNFSKAHRVSRSVHLKLGMGHPFLEEPIIVNSSLELGENNTCPVNQRSPSCLPHINKSLLLATVSSSTQTENFFTTELSSYLSFCQRSRPAVCLEDLKPLDLSLPHRVRQGGGSCLAVMEVNREGEGGMRPPGSSCVKETQVLSGRGESTPSPQLSESDQKSADTTTSGEDSEQPCRAGKLDLIQVRAVQMKLNESFFFKPKGEGRSPRPESPLMILAQGRDIRRRKSR